MTITSIEGILVGHAHDDEALTGCTVVLVPEGTVCGVDVRGGGPGTRETDLLNPTAMVAQVHAIMLCGGSAFGLAAAQGAVSYLYEQGIGYDTGLARVPIVPAAVIYDLGIGRADRWPDAAMGYAACVHASSNVVEGCVGVGIGATAGKLRGIQSAVKTGIGTASECLADGTVIGALVVTNAFGDIYGPDGAILAGARDREGGGFADSMQLLRTSGAQERLGKIAATNTTLAVVATDATLSKAQATKLAQMAQDGLSRVIRPVHTPFDGDSVFALATCRRGPQHLAVLGSIASDVLARAIWRSAVTARSLAGLPTPRDLVSAERLAMV